MAKAKNERRSFLQACISVTGGMVAGLLARKKSRSAEPETVRMMTPEGKVVEVEKRHLSGLSGKAVSNADLQTWMEIKKAGI